MHQNITSAEKSLSIATDASQSEPESQAAAVAGIGQALVAIAKGIGVIGAVAYLYHVERVRGSKASTDQGIAKLDTLIQEGLGL